MVSDGIIIFYMFSYALIQHWLTTPIKHLQYEGKCDQQQISGKGIATKGITIVVQNQTDASSIAAVASIVKDPKGNSGVRLWEFQL